MKNVFDELERNTSETVRGDREMSTCEMLSVIRDARKEQDDAARDRSELLLSDLRNLLALPAAARIGRARYRQAHARATAAGSNRFKGLSLPKTVEAQAPAQGPAQKVTPAPLPRPVPKPLPRPAAPGGPGRVQLSNWSLVATAIDRVQDADHRADRFEVEVHKKWAISMACISFVIIGIVMALRFPRGGIGLVIGGGLLVFSIHYVGLTAGESLADRGFVSPWLAMWSPNIILTDHRGDRPDPGEPGERLDPRRRFPGSARRHAAPGPPPAAARRGRR